MARPNKEAAINLAPYVDKSIRVKLTGGREGKIFTHFFVPKTE
jgi:hypothetical protein